MSLVAPGWCEIRRGIGNVLLVAPHGGRRPPVDPLAPPTNLRVNDVYTPEVTLALAERLGASAIVNTGIDRNRIDLNRASQVHRQAPWFLELLDRELEEILVRHGSAEILFIHGWNNGQLKCDIGVGGIEIDGQIAAPAGRVLSVRPEYLRDRVGAMRAAFQRRGIRAPIGEKYSASHPNNLVQRFSLNPGSAALPQPSFAGCVDALQLELSLPLRCPGEWRERFLDAVAEAFAPRRAAGATEVDIELVSQRAETPADAAWGGAESLQFYDAAAGVGVFAGIGRTGPKSIGGRLLVFLGGQRIALFTGEESGASGVPPLHFERRGKHLDLRFRGPILVLEDAAEYLDLEAALAASRATEACVAVDFEQIGRAGASATLGHVRGEIEIGGRRHQINTRGFSHIAGLRSAGAAQTMLAATFGERRALVGRVPREGEGAFAICFTDDGARSLEDVCLTVIEDGDAYTPVAFELCSATQGPLRATPLNRMAILRSGPQGYVRVAFGVARFAWDGVEGFGLYEHALPLAAATPA